MLEEEDQDWFIPSRDLNNQGVGQLQQQLNGLSVSDHHNNLEEVAVSRRHTTMRIDFPPGGFRSWSKAGMWRECFPDTFFIVKCRKITTYQLIVDRAIRSIN